MRPVGGRLTRESQGDEVARLEGQRRLAQPGRLVGPDPEQLRGDMEGRGKVARPVVHPGVPEPAADRHRLGLGSVVAVDQARAKRSPAIVHQADARALPGQADAEHAPVGPEPSNELCQGAERGAAPGGGILLRPARSRRTGGVGTPHLHAPQALQIERRRAGSGRADIHRDQDLRPVRELAEHLRRRS